MAYTRARRWSPANQGEDHGGAQLTEDDVRLLRAAAKERERLKKIIDELSNRKLAAKFGVSETCVGNAINYITWRHVK